MGLPSTLSLPEWKSPFEVVVVAASLGGLPAAGHLLADLPERFPVPILVVQHLSPKYPSSLDVLLARSSALPIKWAEHGEVPRARQVYLAPRARHLLVGPMRTLRLTDAPPVHFSRPAADPLLQSVARYYGPQAISIILTGGGCDGALGVEAVKRSGGRVLVQDPASAKRADMPEAALRTGCVDFVLPLSTIASALIALVMVPGAAALLRVAQGMAA